jgi:hypothetical protein
VTTNSTSIHIGPETKTWEDPLAVFLHKDESTRVERIMEYLSWENYAVTSNGDIFDSTGRIEIVPEGLAKAIKEAGIHEEANSNG